MTGVDKLRNACPNVVFAGTWTKADPKCSKVDPLRAVVERNHGKVCHVVGKTTDILVIRHIGSDDGPKLDAAWLFGVKLVDERKVMECLGKGGGWKSVLAAADADVCKPRFQGPDNVAHLNLPAVLENDCTVAGTLAYADTLRCLVAVPRTGTAAPYVPLMDNGEGETWTRAWTNAFHVWRVPRVIHSYHEPGTEYITGRWLPDESSGKGSGAKCVGAATRALTHTNDGALRVCNGDAGLLGELMLRLRMCGQVERGTRVPHSGEINWIVAHALRLRRATASACAALSCIAAGEERQAERICKRHDYFEKFASVGVRAPHQAADCGLYKSAAFLDSWQYDAIEVDIACGKLSHARETGRLAETPLALAVLLGGQSPHGLSGLPNARLGDLLRFLCHGLTEGNTSGPLHAAMPHMRVCYESSKLGERRDIPLATIAAFGCPAAIRTLTQPKAQGAGPKRLAAELGKLEWGACLPGKPCLPTTAIDAELIAKRLESQTVKSKPELCDGGVGVLELVVKHLYILTVTSSPTIRNRDGYRVPQSPLALAIAASGFATVNPANPTQVKVVRDKHAAGAVGAAGVSDGDTLERLTQVHTHTWRQVASLAKTLGCTDLPKADVGKTDEFSFRMPTPGDAEALEREVTTLRGGNAALGTKLSTYHKIHDELILLKPRMADFRDAQFVRRVTGILSTPVVHTGVLHAMQVSLCDEMRAELNKRPRSGCDAAHVRRCGLANKLAKSRVGQQ